MPNRKKVIAQCEWAIKQTSPTIIESKTFYEEVLALLKEQHEQIDKLIEESASNYDLYYMQFSNAVLETIKTAKEALTEEEYKLFIESVQRLCEQDIK